MGNEMVRVGVANEGEVTIPVDVVEKWEPKKITYISDTVFFSVEGVFYSMKTLDFKQIFKL